MIYSFLHRSCERFFSKLKERPAGQAESFFSLTPTTVRPTVCRNRECDAFMGCFGLRGVALHLVDDGRIDVGALCR